ncbi:MAG TPA: phosphate acyltransferase PlsX [Gemmatimonadaceae bacterium]|nr:phosphate acyltransferase PlsX [Gemmatimonadaceae bacterium]
MARIALDAMGGDHAPKATVAGALLALGEIDSAHSIQLVGRTDAIREQLDSLLAGEFAHAVGARDRLEFVEAPDVIEMHEKPVTALRAKPNSSMAVGLKLQASGSSDAFVSAGSTGAQMAASAVILKLHEGLLRPAIPTVLPTARQSVVLIDSGANVDCSPQELVQFAWLGTIYAEDILGRKSPGIALLNIGEEPEKGSKEVKEAHKLLREQTALTFRGNCEGRDILEGRNDHGQVDVVVCDGFVGNVLLKFYESVAPLAFEMLKRAGVDRRLLDRGFKAFDYSETGGAPLLGVRGVSIIAHGSSSERALKNALKVALRAVESDMDEHIGRRLPTVNAEPT